MPQRETKCLGLLALFLSASALSVLQVHAQNAVGQKQAAGAASSAAGLGQGKRIFDARCAVCHYGTTEAKKIGPGLKGLYQRGKYAEGKPVDNESLRVWIENGGKDMPGFKTTLSAEQIRTLIAYLKTL